MDRAVCPRCRSQRTPRRRGRAHGAATCTARSTPLAPARLPITGRPAAARPAHARCPVWLPWPLPPGWLVSGFTGAGDERTGARASAVALSGPNPLGGPADLLIIAEEPGVGLGAGLAGLPAPIPATGSPPASRTPPSRSPITRRRSGWWSRTGRRSSSARWRRAGCGSCSGPTPRARCSSSRCRCATCATPGRSSTSRSARSAPALPGLSRLPARSVAAARYDGGRAHRPARP